MERIVAVALWVGVVNLVWRHAWGAGAFSLLIWSAWTVIFIIFGRDFKRTWWVWLGLLILGVAQLNFASFVNLFVSGVGMMILVFTGLYILASKLDFFRNVSEVLMSPVRLGLGWLKAFTEVTGEGLSGQNNKLLNGKAKILRPVLVGLGFGLIFVVVVGGILMMADPIFSNTVGKYVSLKVLGQLPDRAVVSLVALVMVVPLLLLKIPREFKPPTGWWQKQVGGIETAIAIFMVAAVLLLFLIIQSPYVFANVAAETDLSKFGVVTYSEYVRKGFIELLMVLGIGYGLMWGGLLTWRGAGRNSKALILSQLTLGSALLVFAISVLRRIGLYQQFHGWSLIRIYGGIGVILAMTMLLVLIIRHFKEAKWVRLEAVLVGLTVIFISWFNAEEFVVTTHPPTVNGRVDHIYLSRLSEDGYNGWKQAWVWTEEIVNRKEKKVYTPDELREIIYAERVLENLRYNYDSLIRDYGPVSEKQEYLLTAAKLQLKFDEEYLNRFKPKKETDREYTDSVREDMNKIQALMREKGVEVWEREFSPTTVSVGGFGDEYITRLRIYELRPYGVKNKKEGINKLLTFSLSQPRAYERLETDFGWKRLLDLQEKWAITYLNVLAVQPDDQRSFEWDVSTQSPLLGD